MPFLKQPLMRVCEAWGAADVDEDLHDIDYVLVILIVMSGKIGRRDLKNLSIIMVKPRMDKYSAPARNTNHIYADKPYRTYADIIPLCNSAAVD